MNVELILQMSLRGDGREARSAETLWCFLDALAAQGLYLGSASQDRLYRWWEPPQEAAPSQPQGTTDESARPRSGLSSMRVTSQGISPALRAIVQACLGGSVEELTFTAYSVATTGPLVGMKSWCAVIPDEREIYWFVDNSIFTTWPEPAANAAAVDAYLGLLVTTYEVWHPIFGYMQESNVPDTSREQAQAGKPQFLYPINLYGPEIVRALGGLEYVLHAPAWQVRALDDGGALVAPISYVAFASPATLEQEAAVARYLGLPYESRKTMWERRKLQYPSAF